MSLPFLRTLQGDRFFQLLILVGIGLSFFVPFAPKSWPAAIDWHTIITLSGLMLLTKGVELSGYFDVLGRKMVRRFATERRLAMFMVLAAALLSTFLTNDVALFIVVPLTITLKRLCEIPVNRLIIFEALAVNAGSLLTPIGNPQNILIWGRSGLSFAGFIAQMAPLAGAMMLTLLLLCWCCFPGKALQYHTGVQTPEWKPRLVWSCLGLYIVFLTALEFKQELWGLVIVAMFIDVHLLTQLPALQGVLGNVSHLSEPGLWLTAIGLSQVISNVPSTILLLNYVPPSLLLVWAVNVGGFGLLPGSLANLIALRMANDRRIWWRFHLYSIPMLLWAALVGYVLLVILPAN
ncbi:anion transporter [Escherichia coli]|nr:anion transporter [Escherichia coli]EGZ1204144.1 anion transporter [Escherichia coli]